MNQRHLTLTAAERADLVFQRDHAPKPYVRERATAMLRVAEGWPVRYVALRGLLRPRHPSTVSQWLNAYEATRTVPLQKARRRGFSPQ